MQLVKREVRTRTIYPIPEVDENFAVELRNPSDAERNRIFDRHRYIPNHEKRGGMGIFAKVLRDLVLASVIRVDGATGGDGVSLDPTADETKLLLLDVDVEADGERKSLWVICQEKAAEADRADEKNSQTA